MASFKGYFSIGDRNETITDPYDKGYYIETDAGNFVTQWITTTFLLGCLVGAGGTAFISDIFGRRMSIIIGGILFIIGGFLQTFANGFAIFLAGRVFSGLSIGAISMVRSFS
jgi:MFS family permease